ncbi:MAG: lipopolysaccharide heptosyltransferase I, partial [Lentisphaeria bacterium]|nr:lipopolysaccharide heptosyltransferase I [Lentisphaeria bacterium]
MRILIVKPSSLGDIIHVFPALELLRRLYPEMEADWLVHPAFADMLAYSPVPVRRKILFERKKLGRLSTFAGTFLQLLKDLRQEKYDFVFDF